MNYKQEFGKKVLFYRKNLKITQTQLADEISVKRGTIGRIERGEFFPNSSLLFKLAPALNIKLVNLFDFDNEISKN